MLALDCVGADSATRLADTLQEVRIGSGAAHGGWLVLLGHRLNPVYICQTTSLILPLATPPPTSYAQGGRLTVYGCMSGRPASWPWQAWVFKGLQVNGFNARAWAAAAGGAQQVKLLAALGKLVAAGMLVLDFTE